MGENEHQRIIVSWCIYCKKIYRCTQYHSASCAACVKNDTCIWYTCTAEQVIMHGVEVSHGCCSRLCGLLHGADYINILSCEEIVRILADQGYTQLDGLQDRLMRIAHIACRQKLSPQTIAHMKQNAIRRFL